MITMGSKIRLVKPMGMFDNVGEVCEVTDILEGGVICFRFGKYHLGCMSYDEYLKYFEPVEEAKPRKWTEWREINIAFYDVNNKLINIIIKYRNNGKKVQVRSDKLKAESSCDKNDVFDFDKGFFLAKNRLIVKYLDSQVAEIASRM